MQPRRSTRKSVRARALIEKLKSDSQDNTLFEFFNSLEYRPNQARQSLRASYRAGETTYTLSAIPGMKQGDKGQIFIQSQDGFDNDLPPVRLSDKQRDLLINDFQELERVS